MSKPEIIFCVVGVSQLVAGICVGMLWEKLRTFKREG